MAIDSKHPSYEANIDDWRLMRDASAGERVVKAAAAQYLPPTAGMLLDGYGKGATKKGQKDYDAYNMRAVFPDFVSDAVESYIGMLHNKPAVIELPPRMEDMRDKATQKGEGLEALLRRLHVEQLLPGRVGMLLDVPANPDPANPMPFIATYCAETVINWDESADHDGVNSLEIVVLDETGQVRQADLSWHEIQQFRVLSLMPVSDAVFRGEENVDPVAEPTKRVYMQGVFKPNSEITQGAMMVPRIRGSALEQIPFVILNSKDIVPDPDNPPLIGLGRLCMTIYRAEADYRQALFMQGQDTLITIGGIVDPTGESGADDPNGLRTGAGSRIDLNMGGDAKYIGTESAGIPEMRSSLENDRKQAEARSGNLISPTAGKQESGDALTTRVSAQTASLKQIAQSSALALQNILRIAAEWLGEDPEKVIVTPNMEFADAVLPAADLVALMNARGLGAPLSKQSIHKYISDRGLTDKTYDEELELIAEEDLESTQRQAQLMRMLPAQVPAAPAKPGFGKPNQPSAPNNPTPK